MRKVIGFFVGVLVGALVGGVAALLLAPESGAETRERVQVRGRQLMDEAKRAAAAQREQMQAQLDSFKRGTPIELEPEQAQA